MPIRCANPKNEVVVFVYVKYFKAASVDNGLLARIRQQLSGLSLSTTRALNANGLRGIVNTFSQINFITTRYLLNRVENSKERPCLATVVAITAIGRHIVRGTVATTHKRQ